MHIQPQETEGKPASQAVQRGRQLGAAVWAEIERYGIAPTPKAYELWYSYRAGANPALTERMDSLLAQPKALTHATVEALHAEYVAGNEPGAEAIKDSADEIQHAAQALARQVAGGQEASAGYITTLEHWAKRLNNQPTINQLINAVAMLTLETSQAMERNRELESNLAASASRIAKLRQTLTDVKQEAMTDSLTGIANRKAFNTVLKRAIAQARTEPSIARSLLLLDVDHFKRFNDTYGHQTGDLVLRLVARLLADNIKGRDTVARFGGEEFAILLTGADVRAAAIVGQQICVALSCKRLLSRNSQQSLGQLTISVGAAQYRPGDTPASLIARADAALYRAKDGGRNQVAIETDAPG